MKPFLFSLISCLLLTACYKVERPSKPNNLLSEKQMVAVLFDISIVSSAKGTNKKTLEEKNISPKTFIYKKHGIDSLTFAQSNEYYAYNLEAYEALYNKVKDSLNVLKNTFEAEQKKEREVKKEKDSLKKANRKQLEKPQAQNTKAFGKKTILQKNRTIK